jgi:prepilin-type N-terminal cleavage/methylation domain-containing protein
MRRQRHLAFSLIEILVAMVIIAVIAGLTLSALKTGRQSAENLKIAQIVRNGIYPLKEFRVERLPDSIFRATWKNPQNIVQVQYLSLDADGEFITIPPPSPPP